MNDDTTHSRGQRGHAWRICLELVRGSTTRPDTVALNAAASALASGSRWREGLLMATEVDETTVMTLGASVRAGDLGSAWCLAVGIVRSASVSVLQIGQVIYGSVASACEQNCKWAQAQQLLTELMHAALRQNSVLGNTVASAVSRASAWQRLLLSVDLPQADLGTDLLAAAACEDAGQAKALLQLMDERLAIRSESGLYAATWSLASLEGLPS